VWRARPASRSTGLIARAPSARPPCDHSPPAASAPRSVPARSNASRISITSSGFFKPASRRASTTQGAPATGRSGRNGGEIRWPPTRRSGDRRWGLLRADYREIPMAAVKTQAVYAWACGPPGRYRSGGRHCNAAGNRNGPTDPWTQRAARTTLAMTGLTTARLPEEPRRRNMV
jgi:hypothetical protein